MNLFIKCEGPCLRAAKPHHIIASNNFHLSWAHRSVCGKILHPIGDKAVGPVMMSTVGQEVRHYAGQGVYWGNQLDLLCASP